MNYTQIRPRCKILGEYIVENKATVRSTAVHFGVSKSTVHKDVTEHLRRADPILYDKVKEILEKNKEVRHLRGGEATRKKYLMLKTGE
ncbi:MAG: sporulation transcriptional regulator SpoIIID [Clostridia bacterium]|nr:sporulation transcriptional regulator SpoIIID [Clostridia bacterium]